MILQRFFYPRAESYLHGRNNWSPNPSGLCHVSPMTDQRTDLTGFWHGLNEITGPQTRQVSPMTLWCFFNCATFLRWLINGQTWRVFWLNEITCTQTRQVSAMILQCFFNCATFLRWLINGQSWELLAWGKITGPQTRQVSAMILQRFFNSASIFQRFIYVKSWEFFAWGKRNNWSPNPSGLSDDSPMLL